MAMISRQIITPALFLFFLTTRISAQSILMFVSHEDTYYSEYIVMKEALEASGYNVDVRSANSQDFSIYMIPMGTDIEATANSLGGSSYAQFQQQFAGLFGSDWDGNLNTTPSSLSVAGSLLDVSSISGYAGLVVVGGTGALDYRLDGDYSSQGTADRLISAQVVEDIAQKLNDLAVEALVAGKPVMAQCHGASIPVFWRVPGTSGTGVETLGISLLKDGEATGFPEPETPTTLADFGVTHRTNDRVTVSTPNSALDDNGAGNYKIITTRDWYPQTVAHAARTFINIMETYPSTANQILETSVLVVHGGALNESDCLYTNRSNDVPCNHGGGTDLPADYQDLMMVLEANDAFDNFDINPSQIDITGSLSFDKNDLASSLSFLEQFDVVIFYKHWSTGLTDQFLQAIYDYADNGGGVIGLHHALYNDVEGSQNKDILISLFGAQSSASGWSASLANYTMHSTNYGHFISTFGVEHGSADVDPSPWIGNALPIAANSPYSYLPVIAIYDEIYNNMTFEEGVTLGRGVNEITPLFSNDQTPAGQVHTNAFTRLVDFDLNDEVGRIFYIQVGERTENYASTSEYYRMIRNATVWVAAKESVVANSTTWNGSSWDNGVPDELKNATISGSYSDKGFSCANLIITSLTSLTITTGTLDIKGTVTNEGSVIILSGASFLTYQGQSYVGNDITIQRNTRYSDGKYSFVGSPVEQSATAIALGLGSYVYTYDESQSADLMSLSRWIATNETDQLIPAKGYTQASQKLIEFVGKPNIGTITYSGSFAYDGWHLVSNPYAAAIAITPFLDANLNTTETIYIWDDNESHTGRGSNDDYIVANRTAVTDDLSGPDSDGRWNGHIGSAQGFFVKLSSTSGLVTFTENMRVTGNNLDDNFFRKEENKIPIVRLNLTSSDGLIKQTIVGWNESVSDDKLVNGYDAPVFNLEADYAIYTKKAGKYLTIQTITSEKLEISVGYNVAVAGKYTLIFGLENLYSEYYLYDRLLDKKVDITSGGYSFNTQAGQFQDRFALISNAEVLNLDDHKTNIYVFDKTLHIETTGFQTAQYQIYNLSGVSVLNRLVNGSAKINLGHLSNGIYIVSDGIETKKIILN